MKKKQIINKTIETGTKFLYPLALTWEAIYRIRRAFYNYDIFQSNEFRVPIISIGNITFGGTGKTPFTIWISNKLEARDKKVAVLTRGYKGKAESGAMVLEGGNLFRYDPRDCGDEALLISRELKNSIVIVGKKRSENLRYYFKSYSPDVVVLDDGFQHLKLRRNLNIVLFDALLPLSRYKVAPLGYLREGTTALKDADAIIISRSDQIGENRLIALKNMLKEWVPQHVPFADIRYIPEGIYNCSGEQVLTSRENENYKVIAVAGIASPDSFFTLLEGMGIEVCERRIYPDHYNFMLKDVKELLEEAKDKKLKIITTEKDIIKIKKLTRDESINYLRVKIDFLNGEEKILGLMDDLIEKGMW